MTDMNGRLCVRIEKVCEKGHKNCDDECRDNRRSMRDRVVHSCLRYSHSIGSSMAGQPPVPGSRPVASGLRHQQSEWLRLVEFQRLLSGNCVDAVRGCFDRERTRREGILERSRRRNQVRGVSRAGMAPLAQIRTIEAACAPNKCKSCNYSALNDSGHERFALEKVA